MRPPPEGYAGLRPESLSDANLRDAHRELAAWVEAALAAPADQAPDDDEYDAVYSKLSEISQVRAERQREDAGSFDTGRF